MAKSSGFKMKGYTYPGVSPMRKDKDELVKAKGQGKNYDGKKPEDYEVLVTKEIKNLIDAGAPQSVIDAYKLKQKKK
jgi:hypothetical protein|tara:strand:+ start:484 stop:714 length:231 start_codon:yes stop_codon:yes gene_type:complete